MAAWPVVRGNKVGMTGLMSVGEDQRCGPVMNPSSRDVVIGI